MAPCACEASGCSATLSSATGQPCETLELTLTGDCWPDCGSMGYTFTPDYPTFDPPLPPWLTISGASGTQCTGGSQSKTITVAILDHAPPGPVPIRVTGTPSRGTTCQSSGTVTVNRTYEPIEIQYKTFIAAAAVAVPLVPDDQYYAGDYRGFGYGTNLSSKSVQSTTMTLDPAVPNGQVGGPTQFFGTTIGYDDDPDGTDIATGPGWPCAAWTLYPLSAATPNCTLTATAGIGSELTMQPTRVSPTEVKVDVALSGSNPCENQDVVPAIDAHLYVHLRQICQNGTLGPLEFRLYGTHDGFPWHELYINQVAVYRHDACLSQQGPISLLPSEEWQFEAFDENHPLFDGNNGLHLDQWRPVPGLGP